MTAVAEQFLLADRVAVVTAGRPTDVGLRLHRNVVWLMRKAIQLTGG